MAASLTKLLSGLSAERWFKAGNILEDVKQQGVLQLDVIHCNMLREMQRDQLRPSVRSYSGSFRFSSWARAVLGFFKMRVLHVEANDFCCSAVIQVCGSNTHWQRGTFLFSSLASTDLACCNAGLAGDWRHVLQSLQRMEALHVETDVVTQGASVRSFEETRWQKAILLLQHLLLPRHPSDMRSYPSPSSTVAFLEKVGPHGWPLALKLLRGLRCMRDDGGVLPKVSKSPDAWRFTMALLPSDVVSSTAAMACVSPAAWSIAGAVLLQMQRAELEANIVTFNTVISTCTSWRMSCHMLSSLKQVQPSISTFSSIVKTCHDGYHAWSMALHLLQSVLNREVEPNSITFNAALSACEKGGQWKATVDLLRTYRWHSLEADSITYNATIAACSEWPLSLHFFAQPGRSSTRLNLTIASFAQGTRTWPWALRMVSRYSEYMDSFTSPTFISLLSATAWSNALRHMQWTQEQRTHIQTNALLNAAVSAVDPWPCAVELVAAVAQPTEILSWNACLNSCSRCSQWLPAIHLARNLMEKSIESTLVTQTSLVEACRRAPWQLAVTLHSTDCAAVSALVPQLASRPRALRQHLARLRPFRPRLPAEEPWSCVEDPCDGQLQDGGVIV
ncbi:unnamed protein product [Cladocopium goreaui]|uniref:Pentacotripeptide-repeat region of PRORP domain-containing protein n=1 Tax=Cladocopium goreaui TaxID=2562237 RepID=A0A9P1DPT5_9DINO|nr:unnamed protein product [Cladocopium goreaui]